jgi:hypothetical protein
LKQNRKDKRRNELRKGTKWNQRAKEEKGKIDTAYSGEERDEK